MVERLGRVVEAKLSGMTSGDYTLNYVRSSGLLASEELARAVIEALMEPTPDMLNAGVMAHFEFVASGGVPHAARFSRHHFIAMLRTALSQPNEEGEGK